MQMIDTGQKTTSRKTVKKMTSTYNKHKINSEAEKVEADKPAKEKPLHETISMFESLHEQKEEKKRSCQPITSKKYPQKLRR